MPYIINLPSFKDSRGKLTVIEKNLPFKIKRVFYIYDVDNSNRGSHRHKLTKQAAICLCGKCTIFVNDGKKKKEFVLNRQDKCLILEPKDWHYMYGFSKKTILLILASEYFNINDYIFQKYDND